MNNYSNDFKLNLQKWLEDNHATIFVNDENKTNDFIQYMNDFPYLVLEKEDFQKRKRIKNNVPDYNRCIALNAMENDVAENKNQVILTFAERMHERCAIWHN